MIGATCRNTWGRSLVVSGTRVPIFLAINALASALSLEDVIKEYELTIEPLQAALAYVANLAAPTDTIPLGVSILNVLLEENLPR